MKREDKVKLLNAIHKEMLANVDKLKAYDTYKGKVYKEPLENIGNKIADSKNEYCAIVNSINEQIFTKANS